MATLLKNAGFYAWYPALRNACFNPASSSSQSAMQLLNFVNTGEEGAEDQVDLHLDSPIATVPQALFIPPDLNVFLASSIISSLVPPGSSTSSSSSHTKPPPSLSLPPTVSGYPQPTQQHDISIGSMHSITTSNEAGCCQLQKCKNMMQDWQEVYSPLAQSGHQQVRPTISILSSLQPC